MHSHTVAHVLAACCLRDFRPIFVPPLPHFLPTLFPPLFPRFLPPYLLPLLFTHPCISCPLTQTYLHTCTCRAAAGLSCRQLAALLQDLFATFWLQGMCPVPLTACLARIFRFPASCSLLKTAQRCLHPSSLAPQAPTQQQQRNPHDGPCFLLRRHLISSHLCDGHTHGTVAHGSPSSPHLPLPFALPARVDDAAHSTPQQELHRWLQLHSKCVPGCSEQAVFTCRSPPPSTHDLSTECRPTICRPLLPTVLSIVLLQQMPCQRVTQCYCNRRREFQTG